MQDGTLYDDSSCLEGESRVVNSSIFDLAGSLALSVIRFLLLLVFRELSFLCSMVFLICKINCNYEIAADT